MDISGKILYEDINRIWQKLRNQFAIPRILTAYVITLKHERNYFSTYHRGRY